MPIKRYKPTTPARRGASVIDYSSLSKKKPEKSLVISLPTHAGRNNQGKITVRHQGSGNKQMYRVIDFKRNKYDREAKVIALEYDPNRTPFIALLQYSDGEKRYIIAPEGLHTGDVVLSKQGQAPIKPGNTMPLEYIPTGVAVHNIEVQPGKGGRMVRSAGMVAIVQSTEGAYTQVKMPSGEVRLFSKNALATVGQVSNSDYRNVRLGKAGRMRHRGVRPSVTGKSMNPVDHPHGGGEGHQPIGLKGPKSVYGKKVMGIKTRKRTTSNRFIIKKRKKRK
ncbi:MAG: 50S ribosomal protein L2 [Candidatus Jacksonbacteria bacterium RIFCSPLOWO2_02_FULL_43_9]|nr:MAG: 50S ribosomal protein L2 [Parcubacteria group bacterium GW2011_GWA2_43_13]OGY69187.1 MAG: 50S ribosomal protein L2 [Candidatus Jacksonbacteria bacterium RIFCSPHIGHO2_02_FULL_43_10]OGY70503.1 MAG: 50S ribosomal protein L2 [Candidatus Jacksonbacteria bacterium RIFCSPLOWO2_01_FULL_44_13]OGY72825.1 MAG: 50S ribosomal protein L2 [Candidatus Jacksonbacteria bacterium RIFCSPLOWO2_02_FULL_43_9]HAZ17075.1 50S ribosomal protein L2 [Candidatus Jacksonbacteria bacterium]